jgi:hypothetical protein
MIINQKKKVIETKKIEKFVDVSYEVADIGTVLSSNGCYGASHTLVLYNGKIDKEYFNRLALEHTEYPKAFDRDCYYTVTLCLENGRIFVNKTSGTDKYTPHYHRPEFVNKRPSKDLRSFNRS